MNCFWFLPKKPKEQEKNEEDVWHESRVASTKFAINAFREDLEENNASYVYNSNCINNSIVLFRASF